MTERIVCIRCGQEGHRIGQCQWPAETAAAPAATPRRKGQFGVLSIEGIRDRCIVDDITGCWTWCAARDGNGAPCLHVPALGIVTTLGVAIGYFRTGARSPPGVVWHCTCETRQCANPDHRRAGTRSTQMLAAKIKPSPQTRARISAGKRRGAKLSQADADDIRGSSLLLTEISDKYGICIFYACQIRNGQRRKPLAAPGSSVFGWTGPA